MQWKFVEKLKNASSVEIVEKKLNLKFPDYFRKIILNYNNGTPHPNIYDTNSSSGKCFGELLNFNLDSKDNLITEYKDIEDKLPSKVIPFAADPGGNYLCFDYRNSIGSPQILLWNHEQKFNIDNDKIEIVDSKDIEDIYELEFVSNNLNELLDKLYEDTESDEDQEECETLWEEFMNEDELKDLPDDELVQVNRRRAESGLPPILK